MKNKFKIAVLIIVSLSMGSCWQFNRDQAEKNATSLGKQILLKAQSSKQAKIEEAKADYESAKLGKKTRELEAQAKANSIKLISKALRENPEYSKYQQIESVKGAERIYIPTEAGIPILEKR